MNAYEVKAGIGVIAGRPKTVIHILDLQRSFWSYGAVDKSVINRQSVSEEVREREVYGEISSEEITSQHLP